VGICPSTAGHLFRTLGDRNRNFAAIGFAQNKAKE
jgi:hypothetical protein